MSILIPVNLEFDLADRIRKALRASDIGVSELAEQLEVNRNTVGNWINGHITPTTSTLYAIAAVTGVPFEWLKTGTAPHDGGAEDESRPWESNPRPSHYKRKGSPAPLPLTGYVAAYIFVRELLAVSS